MTYNTHPVISVITVCYNAVNELERTILSVLNQTYNNMEYIIIDGGSTDGSIELIKKYEDKISFWVSEPDKGIYDAMNKGIAKANGEWVNLMNTGDIFASNTVLEEIFNTEYNDSVKFLYSDNYYLRKDQTKKLAVHSHKNMSILHQSTIYRKSLHNIHGIYIVTPKLIVSDYLFFSSLPSDYFKKVNTIISINTVDGVSSQSLWCGTQYLFGRVVFRQTTMSEFVTAYFKFRLKRMFPFLASLIGKI